MLIWQNSQNGNSGLTLNTKTGKFQVSVDLINGKHIRKSYFLYKSALRKLKHYQKNMI